MIGPQERWYRHMRRNERRYPAGRHNPTQTYQGQTCQDPWPCAPARLALLIGFGGDRVGLMMYPLYGLTVGNGRTGAMVWSQNGLSMQVSGVDLAQQSTYAAGNVNLFSNPQFDSGYSTYQQRLSLYDGTLTTRYDNNRTVTVMGAPNSEVMGIHVEDSRRVTGNALASGWGHYCT